jgi:hypothetical protein
VRKLARDTGKLFLAIQTCWAGWRSPTEIKYPSIPGLCGIYWPARRAAGQVRENTATCCNTSVSCTRGQCSSTHSRLSMQCYSKAGFRSKTLKRVTGHGSARRPAKNQGMPNEAPGLRGVVFCTEKREYLLYLYILAKTRSVDIMITLWSF